jgi:hypothetical protein
MIDLMQAIWPRPERLTTADITTLKQSGIELDAQIKGLQGLCDADAALYLDAAQRIADEEDQRKTGAESRATTFIAAVAALIPLMTWAISNAESPLICTPGWGCFAWTGAFGLAVVYFITSAYWALKTLAVANYHVIGVEDLVYAKERRLSIQKTLIQHTLLQARRNRDTINQKLTFIKVAQRRFFNGLVVLGLLLMLDPVSRFSLLEESKNRLSVWTSHFLEQPNTALAPTLVHPTELTKKAAPQSPAKAPQEP